MKDLSRRIAMLSPQKRALLMQRNPLSFSQQRLWFLDQLEPGNHVYNIPLAVRLEGRLNAAALVCALNEIVRRHQILRTTFPALGGQPLQLISPAAPPALPIINLSSLPAGARSREAERLMQEEARRSVDLTQGPLFRVSLLGLSSEKHVFLLMMHHIISDGWSFEVFVREMIALYTAFSMGARSPLRELPIQYVDFARWQRRRLKGKALDSLLSYWKRQLAGIPPVLELPADRPRPPVQSFCGALQGLEVTPKLAEAVKVLAHEEGSTLFMALLAVFQALLHRYGGQSDLVVGSPVVNRNRVELESLIGFFLNTLLLRTDLSGSPSFRDLLCRVRDVTLGAHAHQDLPFERLVDELQPERSLDRQPLFQVMFTLKRAARQDSRFAGLELVSLELNKQSAKFDLTFSILEREDRLVASLEYNTEIFEDTTAARILARFETLLEGIAAEPDAPLAGLRLLSPVEWTQALVEWNDTHHAGSTLSCVHHLFEAWAERRPGESAVISRGARLTYGELNQKANRLAHDLKALGVGPDTCVGVCLERSVEMLVGVLAILKAGGAYLPLDPSYPVERLAFMLTDSGARVLLTQASLRGRFLGHSIRAVSLDVERLDDQRTVKVSPEGRALPENLAYVIYTSGSTGTPKGVAMPHRALANLIDWQISRSSSCARTLQFSSLSFDVSFQEMFSTWGSGGALVLVTEELRRDPMALLRLLGEEVVDRLYLPFVGLQQLAAVFGSEEPPQLSLREIVTAGEQLQITPQIMAFCEKLVGCTLDNHYGPTESHVVTAFALRGSPSAWPALPPIGRPIFNTRIYVLDVAGQPVPAGVPGELVISGLCLARGYLGRPDWTAARFVPNPFAGRGAEAEGARLYRTGDLARYRQDGNLELLGRIDTQVKVRGFRVEPGEIETLLLSYPAVRNAVVVAREENGYTALVAYLVLEEQPVPAVGQLRAHLRRSLPEYMVPSSFVFLELLPLTPSGKVDRRALPAPGGARPDLEGTFAAPQTVVQEMVAGVWSEILGRERIGIHDNFFELGGHSLLTTRVVSRLRDCFEVSLPLRTIFESPTVAGLASALEAARRVGGEPQTPPLLRVPRSGALPLSFAQERLWFLDQLDPGNPAYNISFNLRLRGCLEIRLLARSLAEIVRRHEALRTTFSVGESGAKPLPRIGCGCLGLSLVDLESLPEVDGRREVVRLCGEQARSRFDLERGPLLRATLLRSGREEHVLLLAVHHIVFDSWSLGIFLRELSWLYRELSQGGGPPLPELSVQYADFAVWQRRWLQGAVLEKQRSYWRRQLGDIPAALALPADRPRPAIQTFRGDQKRCSLTQELSSRLIALGRSRGTTLFMTLLAGFQALLSRYTGQSDVTVGTPIANRTRSEIEGLIGFFVNTLVLRGALSGADSFTELLSRAREIALGAYDHQDLPFEKLVEELRPERDLGRSPLFQVMLLPAEKAPSTALELPGISVAPLWMQSSTSKFDLTLGLQESDGRLAGSAIYNRDLFDGTTISRLLGHFEVLLAGLVAAPDCRWRDLPMLTEGEREQLLMEWNRIEGAGFREACIHELFEAQVERTPDTVALVCGQDRLSYRQIDERAQRLARHLRSLGIGPEVLVGICLDRSMEMVVGLLGILKAGGAYVPLDPSYPAERLAFTVEDSGLLVLLTRQQQLCRLPHLCGVQVVLLDGGLPAAEELKPVKSAARPENLAYVIYTSGSTGRAKGVAIEHRSVAAFVSWAREVFSLEDLDGIFASTSICFDLSIFELFVPLSWGGKVILEEDALGVSETASAGEITLINTVPSAISELVRLGAVPSSVRTVNLAGEILCRVLVERIHEQTAVDRVFNLYGPSECTTYSTFVQVERGSIREPSIGRPITNTRIHLLDGLQQCVPMGVVGELFIGGAGVARGYWKRPELTAEKFVPDPLSLEPGGRLYRTGDLARYRVDGEIELLGRIDHQVKIRGYRIELGEIESVLSTHPQVRECVVVALTDAPGGDRRLVAYVVAGEEGVSAADLRAWLESRLPQWMVPSATMLLGSLPLTPNGKVDRRALPMPERGQQTVRIAPRTPAEELLVGIWAEVLRLDASSVGVEDNFFALGGHSLLATQVVSRVREMFRLDLALRIVFSSPTVAGLAAAVEAALGSELGGEPAGRIERISRPGARPLSFAQQRLWFMHQLEPGRPDYNVPTAIRLSGALETARLQQSLLEVVRRHEVLRSTFRMLDGEPVQMVHPLAASFPVLDLSGLPAALREPEVQRLAWEEAERAFDLSVGPLLRASLLRLEPEEHVALLTLHHIVSDAWALGVLVREIASHYQAFCQGKVSGLPELPIQYSDFAHWQRQWLREEVLEAQLSYWKRQLGDGLPVLALSTDRPRPPVRRSRGGALPVSLPESLAAQLRELSRQQGATLFMTLLSGFAALLHLYCGQEDLAIGTNVANRNRLETEGLIGFFVNQLVLRTDLSEDPSGRELLLRSRDVALGAYAHQDLPFDRLVEELRPARDASRPLLFQVKLELLNAPISSLELPGLRVSPLRIDRQVVRYDLHLVLSDSGRGINGALQYSSDLFDAATIEQMVSRFKLLLSELAGSPDRRLSELEEAVLEIERQARTIRQRGRRQRNLQELQQVKRRSGLR